MIGLARRVAGAVPVVTGGLHVRQPALRDYTPTDYCDIPSPADRAGDAYHPDVADTGADRWRGYRYWLGFTPYSDPSGADENPCIVASNDGDTWVVPVGLTNPIDPKPANGYNSDTDLVYDKRGDRLVLSYREFGAISKIKVRVSGNGVDWSKEKATNYENGVVSQSVVVVEGVVHAFSWGSGDVLNHTTASNLMLTDTAPRDLCLIEWPEGYKLWHLDVVHAYGRFYGLFFLNAISYGSPPPGGRNVLVGGVSDDGINWGQTTDVLCRNGGIWQQMYRGCLVPAGDGFDAWVGAVLTEPGLGNRIGRTHIPLREWHRI